jgi:hypothetical protein
MAGKASDADYIEVAYSTHVQGLYNTLHSGITTDRANEKEHAKRFSDGIQNARHVREVALSAITAIPTPPATVALAARRKPATS